MIISHRHRFVFLHNPKAGGTSVRKAIEPFNDIGFGFWGVAAEETGGRAIDRAHLGLDEFRRFYPDLWERVRRYAMFSLYRDPERRFLSSAFEHAKIYADADFRLLPPGERRDGLFRIVDRLGRLGRAKPRGAMEDVTLTHFRPQHIYRRLAEGGVEITAFPVGEMARFIAAMSERTGTAIAVRHENAAEALVLPGPLRPLARARGLRRLVAAIPGARALGGAVRRRHGARGESGIALEDADAAAVRAFVRAFYATDYALWPAPTAAATGRT